MSYMQLCFLAVLVQVVRSHPAGIECGTDATTRLRAGQTIMKATVADAPADATVKVDVKGSTVTVTSKAGTYFAARAFGADATLTLTQGDATLNLTKDCSNQVYTLSGNSTTYTFKQTKATSIVVGYASAAGMVSLVTTKIKVSATIPTIKLNNGVEMPMISIGTWQYNSSTAEATVKLALKVGFNHIDTANDYGNQDGVGRALQGVDRASYFLTTKVPPANGATTTKNLQDDLDQLGLAYVDLMLVHFPPFLNNCKTMQDQWKAMEAFYNAGKAKAIGVSNYCVSSLKCIAEVATVTPAVNQISFHVGMGTDPAGLKSYCDSKGIRAQAYSPLGDGTSELITGALVTGIGKAHNMTGAQVSLRWLIENGIPLSTKTTKESHLQQDLGIFGFSLEDTEKSQLDTATSPAGKPSFACTSMETDLVV